MANQQSHEKRVSTLLKPLKNKLSTDADILEVSDDSTLVTKYFDINSF